MKRDLIGETEASEYMSISRPFLQNLRYSRKIEFIKIGGKILYDKNMLDEFIESCVVKPLKRYKKVS